MGDLNKTIIIGRMCGDAELRHTQSGKSVANFSVAVNRKFDREKADFFTVVAWNQSGEYISKYGSKGAVVAIDGRMESRQYEKDGKKITVWELIADSVQLIGKNDAAANPSAKPEDDFEELSEDDELPF